MWIDLENADGVYRITDFNESLGLSINEKPRPAVHRSS